MTELTPITSAAPAPTTGARGALGARVLLDETFSTLPRIGPDAAWRLRPAGELTEGDGVLETGPLGLVVTPTGRDPRTGAPAFADPGGPLGETDHLRWALMSGHRTADGRFGYEVAEDGWLEACAVMSVQAHGLERHPYGEAVTDPRRDLRMASGMVMAVDILSGIVLDFVVTDGTVLAVYERLAFPGTTHGGFSYAVPVADRAPEDLHELALRYDRACGSAHWTIGGVEVLVVDSLGLRCLPEQYLKRDNGKPAKPALPARLDLGVSLFTDQVWGQGAVLRLRRLSVTASC